jgi:phage terminase Nu1 subunit (DNA packaging protein)
MKQVSPQNGESILADYLTEKQLASRLGLNVRTVRQWRIERIGPPVTWVGQSRDPHYRIEAVREWLRSREQPMPRERAGRRITKAQHTAA